jgi:hypothetical protein
MIKRLRSKQKDSRDRIQGRCFPIRQDCFGSSHTPQVYAIVSGEVFIERDCNLGRATWHEPPELTMPGFLLKSGRM